MSLTLGEIPPGHKVILQCVRNTDIESLDPSKLETVAHTHEPVAAMYEFQYVGATHSADHKVHLVDDASLRDIVFEKIADFLSRYAVPVPMVAGISGGGDSNTLVQGVRRYVTAASLDSSKVNCFTLIMDPIWPESAGQRARELCAEAGFEHLVLYPDDIADLLHMRESPEKLWEEFSTTYEDCAHFFGTFLINLAGRQICENRGGSHLLVGYNREDIMAELLFCLVNGRRPLPFPKRRTGEVDCLMPVWDVPKHLLDACYPHYSEINYSERVDTTTPQRSAIYYFAHSLDALVPEMSMSLMSGTAKLMDELGGWQGLSSVPGTPLLTTGFGADHEREAVVNLLSRYFPRWQVTESQTP